MATQEQAINLQLMKQHQELIGKLDELLRSDKPDWHSINLHRVLIAQSYRILDDAGLLHHSFSPIFSDALSALFTGNTMNTQEQIIDPTEDQVADGAPATEAQEQPLNAFYNGGAIAFDAPGPYPMARENEDNGYFIDGGLYLVHNGKVVSDPRVSHGETNEQAPVKKQGKGRRNQKKRQAPPQVGQWLNAKFERKTERGIIVRKGKARFHVDFRDMALAEDGTAIRFQDGDKVRVRVLSMDRTGGLPQASMLGKMLPPVKRPATGIQAEVVGILAGHAVLDPMRPELPSPEAMEEHERFATTVAEEFVQAVEPATEAPAEAVDGDTATEAQEQPLNAFFNGGAIECNAPVNRPANGIQAEVVRILVGHAVLDSMRPELPSQEAMEEHERFANTVAETFVQAVEPATEAPAEVVDSEPATEAQAETDPVD